ncbi:hypothetical protein QFC22_001862 [Naganishia vaughanmartiniae]|uniref:Uncharacterized protein n=1 Tax=Naganishia vaughanmartiniae TaxID=1424756 RepID=A0ACC2XET4_9TREE|nr:hypothetical protein QFC22_001862 [Naganishia vaughanmartiniae]
MTRDPASINTSPLPPPVIVPLPNKPDDEQDDTNGNASASSDLKQRIIAGLRGTVKPNPDSQAHSSNGEWKYEKSIPTMVLYDEKGLRLYDAITEQAPEYYLFGAELGLFKEHGTEIARAMGFPKPRTSNQEKRENGNGYSEKEENDDQAYGHTRSEEETLKERWGDEKVGKWNQGVNGQNGFSLNVQDSANGTVRFDDLTEEDKKKVERGWDIVELGAGSLRKTSVLLNALASTLPSSSASSNRQVPITYNALDLSLPELERTLKQLQEANKDAFKDKIEVRGLWGDYDRGIAYIKGHGLEMDRNREREEKEETPKMEEKPQQPLKDYFSQPMATPVESPGVLTPVGSATPITPTTTLHRTASRSPLVYATGSQAVNRRASTSSFSSFRLDGDMDEMSVNDDVAPHNSLGIRQADDVLDASAWRDPSFKSDLLALLRKLKIPLWSSSHLTSTNVHLQRISGAMTNAVFFCSYNPTDKPLEPTMSPLLTPKIPGARSHVPGEKLPPTLLVRVFGPSSGALIERDQELRILHILSSRYGLGPRIEGIFENGRIEQFFPSRALTPGELRDPKTSCHIAKRMRELHSVDLRALGFEEGSNSKPTVWQCLTDWLGHARNVQRQIAEIPTLKDWMNEFGPLDLLEKEIQTYITYVDSNPDRDHGHGSVFSHNDTQYGNLLILDEPLPPSEPPHRKLIVIDFEYASPNPRGFDIGNHFHEWQADYHHPTHNHSLTHHEPYPTMEERSRFYRSYLSVQMSARDGKEKITSEEQIEQERVDALEKEVRLWSPASSVFWALWGMVQAEEQIQRTKDVKDEEERAKLLASEFDYLKYALGRIRMFRREAAELGALKNDPKAQALLNGKSKAKTEKSSQTSEPDHEERPRHILFLGSSLGNFDRSETAPFLSALPLRPGSQDTLLIGLDGRPSAVKRAPGALKTPLAAVTDITRPSTPDYFQGQKKVEVAYHDPKGKTEDFIMHGLEVVDQELKSGTSKDGEESSSGLDLGAWEYKSRYDIKLGRHEAYYESKKDQTVSWRNEEGKLETIDVAAGELLNVEWSCKYSVTEMLEMFEQAGLRIIQYWKDPESEYRLWLLEKPAFHFPLMPEVAKQAEASSVDETQPKTFALSTSTWLSIPSRQEWNTLWKFWDLVTLDMIPEQMLHQKPIDLRHKCLFYLGHIPAFLDIHLTRLLKGKHTEPEHFKDIFERGIDPHVDDPTKIHDHSRVPEKDEEWPVLQEILDFRDRVRKRLFALYDDIDSGKQVLTRRMGRILWMTHEHEAFHVETILYMLLQSPSTLPPPGFARPNWSDLARQWDETRVRNRLLAFSGTTVTLGHDDRESEDSLFTKDDSWLGHEFGWDNENPSTTVEVKPFRVESLPISNGDYHGFWKAAGITTIPGSWTVDPQTGTVKVKTLYGPVLLEVAQHWPLMASHDEINSYAQWKGGRLPTEAELRVLWSSPMGPRPADLSANVALRNWHPIPPSNTKMDTCGRPLYGQNGGVWEWTSTLLESYPGFETSEVYPGYSTDFYDGLHHVVTQQLRQLFAMQAVSTRISVGSMQRGAPTTISGPSGVTANVGGEQNVMMLAKVSRDFRSDAITIPTDAQLMAGLQASRGDDMQREDETTIALERRIARLTGKEDAMFIASGTAGNQIAIRTNLTQPPHSVLLDSRSHIHKWEAGGMAVFSQAMAHAIAPANGQYLTLEDDILPNLELGDDWDIAPTRVIALENTLSNGMIYPQHEIEKIAEVAQEHGIALHLDGARLWETAAKLCEDDGKGGEDGLQEVKGLGAPIGSVLVGPYDFIARARWFKKMFGCGIRQSGGIAAAADWALTHNFPKLADTHKLTKKLSDGIIALGGHVSYPAESNMVWLDLSSLKIQVPDIIQRSKEMFPENPLMIEEERFVVHHQIEERAIDDMLALLATFRQDLIREETMTQESVN